MKLGWRSGIAAAGAYCALVLGSVPGHAQQAPPASESATDVVGPPQLRDFSLNGTVTREAAPPPTAPPARPAPAARAPSPSPAEEPASADRRRTDAAERPSLPVPAVGAQSDSPPPAAASEIPVTTSIAEVAEAQPAPGFDLAASEMAPLASSDEDGSGSFSVGGWLPWLLAALVLGGGALAYSARQRGRFAFAGGIDLEPRRQPAPPPSPSPPPVPRPTPPPSPPRGERRPAGVVASGLRPWLDIELRPTRAIVTADQASIEFELVVVNSGAGPARDVLIEAKLFNAGPGQDEEIGAFLAHPVGRGERMAQILPLKQVMVKSAISLPLSQLRQFEAGGRRFFIPLMAINALYRWSGGEGQSSTSYLIGRDTNGEKMAPLRLDLGPRTFRQLGARPHTLAVRK